MFLVLYKSHCSSMDVAQSALRKPAPVGHETKFSDHWHVENLSFKMEFEKFQLFIWHHCGENDSILALKIIDFQGMLWSQLSTNHIY